MPAPIPITLAIETSNPGGTCGRAAVALVAGRSLSDAKPMGVEDLAPASRHDDALMPAVERLFRAAGLGPRDISRIAVSVGPGGYTSTRIAATAAKVIAEATGAACFAVPTALALIRRTDLALRAGGPTAVFLAWKRDAVWRHIFPDPASLESADAGTLVPIASSLPAGPCLAVADDALIALWRGQGALRSDVRTASPCFDPVAVFEASLLLPPTDPVALTPLYPREPEAVAKWRDLHPPGPTA